MSPLPLHPGLFVLEAYTKSGLHSLISCPKTGREFCTPNLSLPPDGVAFAQASVGKHAARNGAGRAGVG